MPADIVDSDLHPELLLAVEFCSEAVVLMLEEASRLQHNDSDEQVHALALYATVMELFSACLALAKIGEPTAIPILIRSLYEAYVDLDNLARDPGYVEYMEAANCTQSIKLLDSTSLSETFKQDRKVLYDQLVARRDELKRRGIFPLTIRDRCKRAGLLDQYNGFYGVFCLDTHSNSSALAERHISAKPEGGVIIAIFGRYDPQVVIRRLDFGLQFLVQAGRHVHRAFRIPAPRIDELAARHNRETVTGKKRQQASEDC